MKITPGAPDYKDLALWRVKRFADGLRNKEGMEELTDTTIGPDVRYVLSTNNIDLVRRYLKSPITIEEYRELRYKLLELQLQSTTLSKAAQTSADDTREATKVVNLTPDMQQERESETGRNDVLDQKDALIDLVA